MKYRATASLALAVLTLATATVVEAGWEEGVAAFKGGNYQQAAKEFQTFVDERPDVFQGHYMLGQSLAKLKRNDEALTHLRKALELEPGNIGVQLALGKVYLEAGRFSDAAALLGKIDASSLPEAQQSALHQMLALALDKSGNTGQALAQLQQAARAKPNDASLQYQYGTAALRDGDLDDAIAALSKAAQLDSSDPAKQNAYAQALLRKGRSSTGQAKTQAYSKASSAAQKLVSADPSYDNLMLLAGAQLGAKQFDGALSTLDQAARKNPKDWLPLFYQGQAYTQKDQFGSAESTLKKALDKASPGKDQVTIWKQLGFVYEKQKSYSAAISAYQKAGDSAGVARVEENQKTAQFNQEVEAEAERIKAIEEEQEKLKKELEQLPGGPPPN
jgi:Flp pilus assembly protein TadD